MSLAAFDLVKRMMNRLLRFGPIRRPLDSGSSANGLLVISFFIEIKDGLLHGRVEGKWIGKAAYKLITSIFWNTTYLCLNWPIIAKLKLVSNNWHCLRKTCSCFILEAVLEIVLHFIALHGGDVLVIRWFGLTDNIFSLVHYFIVCV